MITVTDRMVGAALLAEAHVPDGVDMLTRQKLVMRASLTAALAVAPVEGETDRDRRAKKIGDAILEQIEDAMKVVPIGRTPTGGEDQ